jgi:hypothetical protein
VRTSSWLVASPKLMTSKLSPFALSLDPSSCKHQSEKPTASRWPRTDGRESHRVLWSSGYDEPAVLDGHGSGVSCPFARLSRLDQRQPASREEGWMRRGAGERRGAFWVSHAWVLILLLLGMLAGGCGGSKKAATANGTPVTSTSTSTTQSTPVATTTQPRGSSANVTAAGGYVFRVSAAAPRAAVQIRYSSGPQVAPPGKEFVTVVLHITNPLSDRPEPLEAAHDLSGLGPSAIQFGFPAASVKAFGFSKATADCSGPTGIPPLPAGVCGLAVHPVSLTPASNGLIPQIPAHGSVDLLVAAGPVPSTAPLGQITVYWSCCLGRFTTVRIPISG